MAGALIGLLLALPGGAAAGEAGGPLPGPLLRTRAFGPSAPILRGPASDETGRPVLVTQQSVGCVLTGSVATGSAALIGAENFVNLVGGGAVRALNGRVLTLAVLGVTFATFCSIGGALTPLYLHLQQEPVSPAVPPPPPPQEPLVSRVPAHPRG